MKLNFRQLGEQGAPMIILHGLLGASDNWLRLSRAWSTNNRIFLLDLRNHGFSPHAAEHDYEAMTKDVHKFLRDHHLQPAILLGHSMGGKVAMTLALKHPQSVQKLIVVDVAPRAYQKLDFMQVLENLRGLDLSTILSRKDADGELAETIPSSSLRHFLLKNLARQRDGKYQWRINLEALYQNVEAIAGAIPAEGVYDKPTLFIRGEHSPYIRDADVGKIKAMFPKAIFLTVKNAGHWVHAEKPEIVLKTVKKFISSESQ